MVTSFFEIFTSTSVAKTSFQILFSFDFHLTNLKLTTSTFDCLNKITLGLETKHDKNNQSCSGYLKDKSVSLMHVSGLIKPKDEKNQNVAQRSSNHMKLGLEHLYSVFLMLPGNNLG